MALIPKKRNQSDPNYRGYGAAVSLGTTLTAGIVLCSLGGYWLDQKLDTKTPIWTLAGVFLGLVFGGYEVWKVVKIMQAQDNADDEAVDQTGDQTTTQYPPKSTGPK